jgi:hypothetical protein
MSMSDFERLLNEWRDDTPPSPSPEREVNLPDDFSNDDLAFAQELEVLFHVRDEDVPPYFVQTLLESEDARLSVAEPGFEQKTCARVFRRLNLHRQLFYPSHPSFRTFVEEFPGSRPIVTLIAACLVVMIFTMAATSTSFASGWNILWAGAHSGVIQVSRYPGSNGLAAPVQPHKKRQEPVQHPQVLSLVDAQQQLHFTIYWPSAIPDNYSLSYIYLHQGVGQVWADGPVLELDYTYMAHGVSPHGSGRIVICEFKPLGNVFQVVQLGAAHLIQIDQNGNAAAIYVDGQWQRINGSSHAWVYGERSELIYERDGVIFWIAGDQRDGIDSNVLLQIASSLHALDVNRIVHMSLHMQTVMEPTDDVAWGFGDDVVYFDNSDGPLGKVNSTNGAVGTNQPVLKGNVHAQ